MLLAHLNFAEGLEILAVPEFLKDERAEYLRITHLSICTHHISPEVAKSSQTQEWRDKRVKGKNQKNMCSETGGGIF